MSLNHTSCIIHDDDAEVRKNTGKCVWRSQEGKDQTLNSRMRNLRRKKCVWEGKKLGGGGRGKREDMLSRKRLLGTCVWLVCCNCLFIVKFIFIFIHESALFSLSLSLSLSLYFLPRFSTLKISGSDRQTRSEDHHAVIAFEFKRIVNPTRDTVRE